MVETKERLKKADDDAIAMAKVLWKNMGEKPFTIWRLRMTLKKDPVKAAEIVESLAQYGLIKHEQTAHGVEFTITFDKEHRKAQFERKIQQHEQSIVNIRQVIAIIEERPAELQLVKE